MKKIIYTLILLLFFILVSFTIIISTTGVETDKFNDLIIKKINQTNNNINLKLSTIKIKLDVKEISLLNFFVSMPSTESIVIKLIIEKK